MFSGFRQLTAGDWAKWPRPLGSWKFLMGRVNKSPNPRLRQYLDETSFARERTSAPPSGGAQCRPPGQHAHPPAVLDQSASGHASFWAVPARACMPWEFVHEGCKPVWGGCFLLQEPRTQVARAHDAISRNKSPRGTHSAKCYLKKLLLSVLLVAKY